MFIKFPPNNTIGVVNNLIYKGSGLVANPTALVVDANTQLPLLSTSGLWVSADEDLKYFNIVSGNLVANTDLTVSVFLSGSFKISVADTVHLISYNPSAPSTSRVLVESYAALTTGTTIQRRVMTGILQQGHTLGLSVTSAVAKTLTIEKVASQNIDATLTISIIDIQSYA